MKKHWVHTYESDGWKQFGYYTQWFGKCRCGSRTSSNDAGEVTGKSWTFKLYALVFVPIVLVTYGLVAMYVLGIYPFNY